MIMILEDLILTYNASVVLISDASTSASNTHTQQWFRLVLDGFGSFWVIPCFSNYALPAQRQQLKNSKYFNWIQELKMRYPHLQRNQSPSQPFLGSSRNAPPHDGERCVTPARAAAKETTKKFTYFQNLFKYIGTNRDSTLNTSLVLTISLTCFSREKVIQLPSMMANQRRPVKNRGQIACKMAKSSLAQTTYAGAFTWCLLS